MPDNTLDCVVWVGAKTKIGLQYRGTAFYVAFASPDARFHYLYLVTAKHNVEEAALESPDGKVLIRPNWADEMRTDPFETVRADWVDHPDADVSILDLDVLGLRHSSIDSSMILTEDLRRLDNIGVGDELQITGLFIHHRGNRRNVPVVRSGIIAAMPDPNEPVYTSRGEMDAYLAEVRSLGGLSGSPVFVVLPGWRKKASGPPHEWRTYLLGLVHGHWDQRTEVTEYVAPETEKIHQGMAVVVPASKILDLLNSPNEQTKREAALARIGRSS
jgi:hypothetical protein